MSTNGSNRTSTSKSADVVNSSRLTDPASLTELESTDIMETKFEEDSFADVEFKPGADFEVDDSLFQSVTMKEDFLDFNLSYTDHAYCNAELEGLERGSADGILEVENEEEIQDEVGLFEDVDDSAAAVGTEETSPSSKKRARIEELKAQDDGPSEDKKKVAVVKTYNMRSKRLAADGKGGQQDDAGEDKKVQPATKKRKVEVNKAASIEESSGEDEDDEEEASDSDEEVTVQSKRRGGRVQPKKGAATKGKGKGKAKNAKGKRPVKGKQTAKKASKADSDDEEDNEDADEPVAAKNWKKTNAKGKAGAGKRKAKPRKKPETESSEESEEEEEEESESEDDEIEEVPVRGGRGNQKRTGKWKGGARSVAKKRKAAKKTTTKAADESESEATSSDDLPLQEVKKLNRKKKTGAAAASLKTKTKKGDTDESSEEEEEQEVDQEEEEEADENDDIVNMGTRSKKNQGKTRDPILSAFSKSPGVLMTDDSASVCSTDDGTPGVRTSSRIKKPNRMYVLDGSTNQVGGKTNASQKTDKVAKAKNKEQLMSRGEAPTAALDISETTDTDALVIDESPLKYAAAAVAIGSTGKQSVPEATKEREEQYEAQVNEGEDEEDEDEEESNNSGELSLEENQQMASDPASSQTSETAKRSARLKMIEEATQEKFKAFRAERERTEAKNEAQKKKNQEKFENDVEREEKPKPAAAAAKVTKDVPAKQSGVSAVKNPCRGPSCGKASLLGSVYCSDVCIQNHALESIRLIEQERQKSQPQRMKTESSGAPHVPSKSDERIVVFERKTGKLLTGPVAPTESTLLSWLKKHPTFEVLQPSSHSPAASFNAKKDKKPEKKVPIKALVSKELVKMPAVPASQQRDVEPPTYSGSSAKEDKSKVVMSRQHDNVLEHSKPVSVPRGFPKTQSDMTGGSGYSRGGPDPARISIRNSLREALFVRANETDDVMLSGPEIKRLALDIEQELFGYYGEVNTKYKHKYRTLITHLKDQTNKGLFRKVLFGELKPNRLVRLSSDSLGSRELAYWKDPNAKVKQQEKSFEAKTVKKAEFVPKSPYAYDPSYDFLSSIIVDTTPQHGNHFFDINCKICTGKIPEPLYYDANKTSHVASMATKEEITPPVAVEAEPVAHSKPTKDDERVATIEFSRDPRRSKGAVVTANSSAVSAPLTIVTSRTEEKTALLSPPSIVSPIGGHSFSNDASGGYQMGLVEPLVLWKGSVYAHDVAKVMVCAYLVSGSLPVLKEDLSDLIVISGRLPPENVFYYLSQIKQSGTFNRDIAIVRFESAGLHDDDLYNQLFSYLNNRDRCGVVSGSSGPTVKDMYIVPVASRAGLPSLLQPADGPGLDDNHPNLLLGVIVKHSYKRPAVAPSPAKPLPAPTPTPAPASAPAVTSSAKTWMYSERSEMKEEPYPETKRSGTKHGTRHVETATQKLEPVEEYTPLLPTFESKALPTSKSSSASKLSESGNADSSGASDMDETEDLSEVAHKDPIISKYSKFDRNSRTPTRKRAAFDDFDDEDKPYDPFEEDDNKPYDPCSPEFVATTTAVATAPAATTSTSSGMAAKYNPSSAAAVAPSVVLSPPQSSTSAPATSIDLAQVLKPMGGLSYTTDVTAAMLTTLAAISTTTNVEEQRRLLSELTEKINEQQVCLDRQKEDLKKKESSVGLSVPSIPSAGIASMGLASMGSGSKLGQPGFTSGSSSDASAPFYSGTTSTSASGCGKAPGESGAASSNRSAIDIFAQLGSIQTSSVLSQLPVDSSAILNLARKRLALKAGDSHSRRGEPAPPVSVVKSDAETDAEKLSSWATTAETVEQNADAAQTEKQTTAGAKSAFSCNLSVLPLSVQQLLSGSSFENLKSIVANVTGKKTSDGSGQSVETSKTGEVPAAAADMNAQVKPDSEVGLGRASDDGRKLRDAATTDEHDKETTSSGGKNSFASNRHGDVDYRVQSSQAAAAAASSSDAPKVSKGFDDISRPSVSHVASFPGYSDSNAIQYSRPQFSNPSLFGSSGPGLMGPGPAHLMLRPSDPGRFRPSMHALLETPGEPASKGASEMKPALLKTPEMLPVSDPKPMQHPPFPPDMPRPPLPADMQRPSFLSDMENKRPPFSAESQGPQPKGELQRNPFPPQMPRPPLLPDIPQPPFPPQVPRPPFPPGMQRPPFMPEMPRPPFMPEMPRMCIPYSGPGGSSGAETHLKETASGLIHSDVSGRLSNLGLLPVPKQTESAVSVQDKLSSPSDRHFASKSMLRGNNLQASRTESNAGDASKPFSVGDFLKQLDSSRNQPPAFPSHSRQDSKDASNVSLPPSSSDDAAHRERKVLLPTPKVESMRKIPEKSHDAKPRKTDEPRTRRASDDQKRKTQISKKPDDSAPAVRRWSAKSDWEKTSAADKASPSDSAPVIVIDETMEKDSVEMIPLPPGSCTTAKTDGNEADVEIISYNAAGAEEKPADGSKSVARSSQDRSRTSGSADRSRSRSKREPKEPSDSRSHRSDRGHHRSHDRHRRSRSKERSDVRPANQRGRRRSRERFSSSYQQRSRDRRGGVDQSKRPARDQRRTSPSADQRKREEDLVAQMRIRNQESLNRLSTSSDQPSFERTAPQSNRPPPQGGVLCGDINLFPKPASVPSLIDMMEPSEPLLPKPAIPSLLDIMGVSRESISQSARGGLDSKPNSRNTGLATSGVVDMKYRRDYKHGSDPAESSEHGRPSFARTPDFAERNPPFSGPHGRPDILMQRDVEMQPSDCRDRGRHPSVDHGDFRRPEKYPFERRDLMEERQPSPMEVSAGHSFADSGNTFGRQYLERTGPPKRPLIDKPPERDFERFGRPMPEMAQEGTGSRGDMGPGENMASMPDIGYRSDERLGIGFPNRDEVRHRGGGFGPDGRMPSNFPRMRPFSSPFPPELNPEKQVYGPPGPGGPGSTSMMSMELDESGGRFSHPSMLKRSLLGDYPGMGQDPMEETPAVTAQFESLARADEFSRERNVGPDERRLGRRPLMPEPYHTTEGKQTALMLEPRHNVEGRQTGLMLEPRHNVEGRQTALMPEPRHNIEGRQTALMPEPRHNVEGRQTALMPEPRHNVEGRQTALMPEPRHNIEGRQTALMPEPRHNIEGRQTALMLEPRHNVEGKQTPPGWAPDVGDVASGQPRLLNMRFPSNVQGGMRPGYGLVPPQRPPPVSFSERGGFSQMGAGPRMRMPPEFGRAPEHMPPPQFSGGPESQPPPRHNPVLLDRHPENSGRQFSPAGMEGPPESADGMSEKKTLLPVPPMPGPHLTEMGVRMGPRPPRQMMPSIMDGLMFMPRPGMRMPPRFLQQRPMGFPEGPPRQPGLRQQAPSDPRSRGPST